MDMKMCIVLAYKLTVLIVLVANMLSLPKRIAMYGVGALIGNLSMVGLTFVPLAVYLLALVVTAAFKTMKK